MCVKRIVVIVILVFVRFIRRFSFWLWDLSWKIEEHVRLDLRKLNDIIAEDESDLDKAVRELEELRLRMREVRK